MAIHHPHFTPEPRTMTVEGFFSDVAPEVLRTRREAARALGGRIAFELVDEPGRWVIDLDRAEVHDGDAEACVRVSRPRLEALLTGRDLGVGLEIEGDVRLLTHVAIVFQP